MANQVNYVKVTLTVDPVLGTEISNVCAGMPMNVMVQAQDKLTGRTLWTTKTKAEVCSENWDGETTADSGSGWR